MILDHEKVFSMKPSHKQHRRARLILIFFSYSNILKLMISHYCNIILAQKKLFFINSQVQVKIKIFCLKSFPKFVIVLYILQIFTEKV